MNSGITVVAIIGMIVIVKVVELLIASVYKKLTVNEAVTKADCDVCKRSFRDDIKIIKGMLLVIAVKIKIPEEQIKELIGSE